MGLCFLIGALRIDVVFCELYILIAVICGFLSSWSIYVGVDIMISGMLKGGIGGFVIDDLVS
jgi:hypothetical protein